MRSVMLVLIVGLVTLVVLATPPLPQDSRYHAMADHRSLMGIPNALNVLSNLPFAFVGTYGLALTARKREPTRWSYVALFGGTALTAIGSTYYHLAPDNARLVWDRLPMTIGFAGLMTALIGERVNVRSGQLLVGPAVLLGIASVVYWHVGELSGQGDLRPYAVVQFGSLLVVVLILLLYRKRNAGTAWFVSGLLAYGVAKVLELADQPIFALGQIVSGHTLKHLAAAGGVACIAAMLRARATSSSTRPAAMAT